MMHGQKNTEICEPLRIISVKYNSILPDDGSLTIRNMPEWFLILCLLKFLYNVDFKFYNYTQRPKLGRLFQLHATKSMEGPSFHNAYTQEAK